MFLLGGSEQRLDFSIPLGVVFGGLHDALPGEGFSFDIEGGVSPAIGVQFLLEFGVVGDAGGVHLVVVPVVGIEPQFFLVALHGGGAVVRGLLAGGALAVAVARLREALSLVALELFRKQHC